MNHPLQPGGHHHQGQDLAYADRAAFFIDRNGQAAVAFSDPSFIRSDMIVVDRADHSVHAILHESDYLIGHVSTAMAETMIERGEVLLAAVHVNGHIVDLYAPVCAACSRTR